MITADLEFEEHDGQIVVSHQFQEKQFIAHLTTLPDCTLQT